MIREFLPVLRVAGHRNGNGAGFAAGRKALPELFSEEGHGRVEQAKGSLESRQRVAPAGIEAGTFLEAELFQLEVPVAELVPEEVPEHLGGFVIPVGVDS